LRRRWGEESASILEHFVDKPFLGYGHKEVFREFGNSLISRRRFKRKLTDHLRR
jgi:hypothetical protein